MIKVLYIGWIGYNNLGDELMLDLFKQRLSQLEGQFKLEVVNNEERFLRNVSIEQYDLIVLGGGSIISGPQHLVQPYIIETLHKALTINKKVMIWCSGMDWIPKSYITHLESGRKLPLTQSTRLQSKLVDVFEESIWAGVRGPLTFSLLQQFGVEKNIQLSGDPGFLMKKKPPHLPKSENQEKIIGVNWGTAFNVIYGNNETIVEDHLANALNKFIEQGYSIHLFVMFSTDIEPSKRLYEKIKKKDRIVMDETLYNHEELISIIERFAFTINFKLHANYLSLAAHVPFIALGYRFKVFDFVKSVDLENYIVSTDAGDLADQLLITENSITRNQKEIIKKMRYYQSLYSKRINQSFEEMVHIK